MTDMQPPAVPEDEPQAAKFAHADEVIIDGVCYQLEDGDLVKSYSTHKRDTWGWRWRPKELPGRP